MGNWLAPRDAGQRLSPFTMLPTLTASMCAGGWCLLNPVNTHLPHNSIPTGARTKKRPISPSARDVDHPQHQQWLDTVIPREELDEKYPYHASDLFLQRATYRDVWYSLAQYF